MKCGLPAQAFGIATMKATIIAADAMSVLRMSLSPKLILRCPESEFEMKPASSGQISRNQVVSDNWQTLRCAHLRHDSSLDRDAPSQSPHWTLMRRFGAAGRPPLRHRTMRTPRSPLCHRAELTRAARCGGAFGEGAWRGGAVRGEGRSPPRPEASVPFYSDGRLRPIRRYFRDGRQITSNSAAIARPHDRV